MINANKNSCFQILVRDWAEGTETEYISQTQSAYCLSVDYCTLQLGGSIKLRNWEPYH